MTRTRALRTGTALLLTAFAASPALAQKVGTAAAVNPASTGKPPGGGVRTLTLGSEVVHNERIQTTSSGSVQLLFVDKTAMSIGPDSDVTIDEYVFDPSANTGKMAVTVGKGLMRFVGGQISHSGDATVKTPTASIGIRGGTGIFDVRGDNTRSINLFGQQSVSTGAGSVSLLRPGSMTDAGRGRLPSIPIQAPLAVIASYNAVFEARPGQTGGSGGVSQGAVQVQLAKQDPVATISSNSPGVQDAGQNAVRDQLLRQTTLQTAVQNTTQTANQGAQTSAADTTATVITQQNNNNNNNNNTPRGPFPAGAFALSMTNCCDPKAPTSAAPYLPASFAPPGNQLVSPVLGFRTASMNPDKPFNGGAVLQYGVNITGDNAAQSSWFFVATGHFNTDAKGNPVIDGGFDATNRLSSNLSFGRASGPVTSAPNSVTINSNGIPTAYTVNANGFSPETGQFLSDNATVRNGGVATATPYQFTQAAAAMPTPAGLGSNRPDAFLIGFAGGVMQSHNNTTNVTTAPYAVTGASAIVLSSSNSALTAAIGVQNTGAGANQLSSGSFSFGEATPARFRSAYIDYDHFGARGAVTVVNGATNTLAPISQVNGQTVTAQTAAMVTVTPADAQAIAVAHDATFTFCQCDFTRWGLWSNDSTRSDPNTGQSITDFGHMMFWVAGQLTDPSLMPQTGTATYNGHVIANVANAGAQYISASGFTNAVNFAARTGNVTVSELDGTRYAGTVNWSQGSSFFNGALNSTTPQIARSMTMNGAFFNGVAGPAGEMGGSVNVTGANYIASGIFAGKR